MSVTFDGPNKLIICNYGTSALDVKSDIYSTWKIWQLQSDNMKYLQAMNSVGGDPLPGSKALGSTYFLLNGWKIRPYEGNHTLTINGNLYCSDGSSPYVSTLAAWSVFIISAVSSLVDSTVQQLPEIEQNVYQEVVHIDSINGIDSTLYPYGTKQYPVKTLDTAKLIATQRGFETFHILGSLVIGAGESISNYTFVGTGVENTKVYLSPGCTTGKSTFRSLSVSGTQNGETHYFECEILELKGVHCKFEDCLLTGPMTMEAGSFVDTTVIVNCYTGWDKKAISPALKDEFVVDLNNSSLNMVFNDFNGKIKFINLNHPTTPGTIALNVGAGKVTVDSSCTTGTIKVRGDSEVVDNSNGTLVDNDVSSNLVWQAVVNGITAGDRLITASASSSGSLSQSEHDKLMSLNNIDTITLIDSIWDKVLPNGVPVKDYITYKLLTTNKYIGLS